MNKLELKLVLESHLAWLTDEGGNRADLYGANLRDADLCNADLCNADLRNADLCNADLRGADLCNADLRGADLRGANLRNANLCDVIGNKRHLKSGQVEQYSFVYTDEYLQIGCERHKMSEWWVFADSRIAEMDNDALVFWRKWKPWFQQLIEKSPARPTKDE